MARTSPIRRFFALDLRDRLLLAEAVLALGLSSAMIRALPFRRVVAFAKAPLRQRPGSPGVDVARMRWAVEASARRAPWRAVCFQRALALHMLLRRRGVASGLHYGISRPADGALAAHVWLSVDGTTVIGGEAEPHHVPVATFLAGDAE